MALLGLFPFWFYLTFTVWICPRGDHNHVCAQQGKPHSRPVGAGERWPTFSTSSSVYVVAPRRVMPGGGRVGMTKQHQQNYPNEPASRSNIFYPLLAGNGCFFLVLTPVVCKEWAVNTSVLGSPFSAGPAARMCQSSRWWVNHSVISEGGPWPGVWSCHSQVPPIPVWDRGAPSLPATAQHLTGRARY